MRQKTSLRVWASRGRFSSDAPHAQCFEPASPTPLAPRARGPVAASAMQTPRHRSPRSPGSSAPLEKLLQGQSIRPRLVQDRPIACSDAHLGFPSSEIDRTMLHGWFLLFAANRPRVNRERRYSVSSSRRSQPLHPVCRPSLGRLVAASAPGSLRGLRRAGPVSRPKTMVAGRARCSACSLREVAPVDGSPCAGQHAEAALRAPHWCVG